LFHKFIFKRIADYNKFKVYPKIEWGYVGLEELNQKARRLTNYAKAGIVDIDKFKEYVIKSEKL
jgi:hypothetical protein